MKDFVCVQFDNKSTGIVYSQWMVGKSRCRWPPSGVNVRLLAESKETFADNWTVHKCKILCQAGKQCGHSCRTRWCSKL